MATIPVSTIPGFKAALQDRLLADATIGAATPPVPVMYGLNAAGVSDVGREFIMLGWTQDQDPTNGDSGRFRGGWSTGALGVYRNVEERYILECAAVRIDGGINGQRVATERSFAIFQLVVSSLVAWANADYAGLPPRTIRWALVCGVRHQEGNPGEEFRSIVSFDIAVSARLTGAGSP